MKNSKDYIILFLYLIIVFLYTSLEPTIEVDRVIYYIKFLGDISPLSKGTYINSKKS
jgi:hypothetical protein